MMNAALDLAERGFAVFPLSPGTKIPITGSHGVHDATTEIPKIEQWWAKYPDANIGIGCGKPSNIVVIDIDPKNGGDKSVDKLEENGNIFPKTLSVSTPNKGRHLYYRWDEGARNSSKALGVGIDVLSTGKAVTAPPSIVKDLQGIDRCYTWNIEDECFPDPVPLPYWVKLLLKPLVIKLDPVPLSHSGSIDHLISWLQRAGSGSNPGDRNHRLFWASARAAILIQQGKVSSREAEALLLSAAKSIGLHANEALPTIYSGFRRGGA
jgi:hypothetical protein